ncbi:MAG: HD domain-containing protein [Candidatus Moraniibacteriota bacterium]
MNKKQEKIKNFLREAEKLKQVKRKTYLSNKKERESAAEHSWDLILMAMALQEYFPKKVETLKIIKILAVHDLAEIDNGDVFALDKSQKDKKIKQEKEAAERIFNILPKNKKLEFSRLWQEYEEGSSIEARVAKAIDRMAPIAQFNASQAIDKKFKVSTQECYDYAIESIKEFPKLKNYFLGLIRETAKIKKDKVEF